MNMKVKVVISVQEMRSPVRERAERFSFVVC